MTLPADLELNLRRAGDAYTVEMQFTPAGSSAPVRLIAGDPPLARLDEPALQLLREAALDMRLYGERLTSILFADPRLAAAFGRAAAAAQGAHAPLRLRLCLDERDPLLHSLHWEALRDPASPEQALLSASERLRFSRFLSSADMQPLRPRPLAARSALVVVANPAGLERYKLAPVDVAAEVARARDGLGDVPTTVLAQSSSARRATLDAVADALRAGPDILYLVCHGTLRDGEPYLWLEDEQGEIVRVAGSALVEQIQNLEQRPLLVVLGSCQSAGNAMSLDALAALGPRLAAAGIAAVVAMQGDVAMSAVATFTPIFFREVLRDGQVDRAMAAARAALLAAHQWWQPVLWMRMRDGQLWTNEAPAAAVSVAPRELHNLPSYPTRLIGRSREVEDLCALLRRDDVRLVTLLGPGGTGKTRLAVQAGWELREHFADGVWFVHLTEVRDPGRVIPTLAQILNVADDGSKPLVECVQEYLRPRQLLLILDNFEQVIAAAPLVAELLAAAPRLEALVTSRAALRITGEYEYPVAPLALPDLRRLPRAADELAAMLLDVPSVALFVARAQAVKPGFAVTAENARAIAEICVQLDGLPLAIELAAARSRLFAPQAILVRLGSRLSLLTGGSRDLPTHQQTLRGAIDWSYDLLEMGERTLFTRLAVFVGGCTIEAAEAICGERLDIDLLDGLTSLVEKSLIRQIDAEDGETRFTMLQTIREYAWEKLEESGEAGALCRRHAEHFLALAEQAEPNLTGARQEEWLKRLEREHDNLRGALGWAIERQAAEVALQLGGALWRFWYTRAYLSEGRRWLEQGLAVSGEVAAAVRAKALAGAGGLAHTQSDYARAIALYEESLTLRRALGDKRGIAIVLNNLGLLARDRNDYAIARARLEEALAVLRDIGDQRSVAGILNNLGMLEHSQEQFARARALYEESLELRRQMGDKRGIIQSLNNLGLEALHQGDAARAQVFFEENLVLSRKLEDSRRIAYSLLNLGHAALAQRDLALAAAQYNESLALLQELEEKRGMAECLEGLAGVAAKQGLFEPAARVWGAADAVREAISAPLSPAERARHEQIVAEARAQVDVVVWAKAWTAGRAMALEQALAEAIGEERAVS
jgi:predicted ATPase/Tfp pilus assembly protein PilF